MISCVNRHACFNDLTVPKVSFDPFHEPSQGDIVRQHLEHAHGGDTRKFMRLAGTVGGGPTDLSRRKGFSKR
jgi:hypothetical protein